MGVVLETTNGGGVTNGVPCEQDSHFGWLPPSISSNTESLIPQVDGGPTAETSRSAGKWRAKCDWVRWRGGFEWWSLTSPRARPFAMKMKQAMDVFAKHLSLMCRPTHGTSAVVGSSCISKKETNTNQRVYNAYIY